MYFLISCHRGSLVTNSVTHFFEMIFGCAIISVNILQFIVEGIVTTAMHHPNETLEIIMVTTVI